MKMYKVNDELYINPNNITKIGIANQNGSDICVFAEFSFGTSYTGSWIDRVTLFSKNINENFNLMMEEVMKQPPSLKPIRQDKMLKEAEMKTRAEAQVWLENFVKEYMS